jgi:hypothetical protein
MKILKAKQYLPELIVKQFVVKDLMILPGEEWLNKRMPLMRESIDKSGMIWPVVVTDDECYWHGLRPNWPKNSDGTYKKGLAVHTGNKRVKYALENNYDLIEGYFVKSKEEQVQIIIKTSMSKDNWPK